MMAIWSRANEAMELDFHKEKERIAALSDAELIARLRNPKLSATDRMLVEAEISRRGLNRRQVPARQQQQQPMPEPRRSGINFFSILIILVILGSVVAGVLEDFGIDVLEWLRELFEDKANLLLRG